MHKSLERLYNRLVKIIIREVNKIVVRRKEEHEAMLDEDKIQQLLQGHKSLPPCDAKNPYRFL